MIIRNASENDLPKIAKLHIRCFPDSFSTQLGEKLLAKFYREYLKKVPELFLVAEANDEIVGICMGYYCEDNAYQKNFLKRNFFMLGLRCIKLTLERNDRMLEKFGLRKPNKTDCTPQKDSHVDSKEKPAVEKSKCGDLLSICVREDYRGQGVSSNLVACYHNVLKKNVREVCILSVKQNNNRAISFYKKMGYSIVDQGNGELKMSIML